jgi:hypothetical protein
MGFSIGAIKLFLKRFSNARKIEKFDRLTDKNLNNIDNKMKDGWYTSKIDTLLEAPGITEKMRSSSMRVKPTSEKRIHLSWDVPNFVIEAVLNSELLRSIVREYLGPGVRLDDIYVKNIMDGLESASEGWHDDNVGYRLKLFMVFDVEGDPSGTIVIPTSRPNLYQLNLEDESSRIFGSIRKEPRGEQKIINYTPGDCLLFDTNLSHRGDYSSNTGIRYCVIAEFIDRDKANALRGRAPCGPGQGRLAIHIPETVKDNPLIDQALYNSQKYGY